MARLDGGLHGPVNGAVGDTVYQTNHGRGGFETIARARADRPTPDAPEMQEGRERMAVAQQGWKDLSEEVREYVRRPASEGQTARNKYASQVVEFINEDGEITRQPDFIRRAQEALAEDSILPGDQTVITDFENVGAGDFDTGAGDVSNEENIVYTGERAIRGNGDNYRPYYPSGGFSDVPSEGSKIFFRIRFPSPLEGWSGLSFGIQDLQNTYSLFFNGQSDVIALQEFVSNNLQRDSRETLQIPSETWLTAVVEWNLNDSGIIMGYLTPAGEQENIIGEATPSITAGTFSNGAVGLTGNGNKSTVHDLWSYK